MTTKEKIAELAAIGDEILLADGFDEAIIGFAERGGLPTVATYDTDKCIDILMARDGMTEEDAVDYFYYNVVGAYMGEYTPVFVTLF